MSKSKHSFGLQILMAMMLFALLASVDARADMDFSNMTEAEIDAFVAEVIAELPEPEPIIDKHGNSWDPDMYDEYQALQDELMLLSVRGAQALM